MELLFALSIGALCACGVYLMLRPHLVQFLIGLLLVSNAVNLLIFTMGRLGSRYVPIAPPGALRPLEPSANPLPQALILTAIVIGFSLIAFGLVLFYRTRQSLGTFDSQLLREAETSDDQISDASRPLEVTR